MSRLGAKWNHFFGKGQTWGHFWQGTETVATGGSASGTTFAPVVSLIPGTATGIKSPTVAGVTLTPTVSLIAGAAHISSTAHGVTITGSLVLSPGHVVIDTTRAGATLTATASLIAGHARVDATAPGHLNTITAALLAGSASGIRNPIVLGATFTVGVAPVIRSAPASGISSPIVSGHNYTVTSNLFPGHVNVRTVDTLIDKLFVTIIPGHATGARNGNANGAIKTVTTSLIPGSANAQVSGTASGSQVTAQVQLTAGVATATRSAVAAGHTVDVGVNILAGAATGTANATAAGADQTVTVSFDAGIAFAIEPGGAVAIGSILEVITSVIAGTATGDGNAQGDLCTVGLDFIPGGASADNPPPDRVQVPVGFYTARPKPKPVHATAHGAIVSLGTAVHAGGASGTTVTAGDREAPYLEPSRVPQVTLASGDVAQHAITKQTDISCFTQLLEGKASVDYTDRNARDDAFVLEYLV